MKSLFPGNGGSTRPALTKTELHQKYTTGVVSEGTVKDYFNIMNNNKSLPIKFDQPAVYEIVVNGTVSPDSYAFFQGITASSGRTEGGNALTVFTGPFADQAQLGELFNLIYEQQLAIISVRKLSD